MSQINSSYTDGEQVNASYVAGDSLLDGAVLPSEVDAINAILSAAGESPMSVVDTGDTSADVLLALQLLRNTAREVLSMKWKFNTEHGYQVAPTGTYSWVDTDGVTTSLNIFLPPVNLLGFDVSPIVDQQGSRLVDTVIRPSRKYNAGNSTVFYDRILNRDGFPATDRPYLFIEPVWAFTFDACPEEFRRYVTIRAARQFVQQAIGSQTLSSFTAQDELYALRNLRLRFGEEDEYNMLQNSDVAKHLGCRPRMGGYVNVNPKRRSPGPV